MQPSQIETAALQLAFLRAINVGGTKAIPLARLRQWMADLGYREVRSILHSGNLVFHSPRLTGDDLERDLEAQAEKRLGLKTLFFVRSAADWAEVIAANPFRAQAKSDPSHLVVLPLKTRAEPARVKALQAAITGSEIVAAGGPGSLCLLSRWDRALRLTVALIEKTLGTPATGRNWNTALKVAALAR